MAAPATPPVAVPRPAGGDIIIRRFEPRDTAQLYALLDEGFVYGPESPANTALRRHLTSPMSLGLYSAFSLGLIGVYRPEPVAQLGGLALCAATAALFAYMRRAIPRVFLAFCDVARTTDLADIRAHYTAPGAFWVAAIDSPDGKASEVVGCLGLDPRANADPTSAELRRMVVSPRHRRRRLGTLLMTAALAHAQRASPPLRTLDLETSVFQPGARKLYENHGFSVVECRIGRWHPLFWVHILRFRRNVGRDSECLNGADLSVAGAES
ncbi:acyl-CoA N-acyltransferase [Mycena belliarum]|uniref:Acyl-CoA N-acyltransferase n=1 Tax=Mycena belliarum TaxID=1033014 RepID=A0AAD6TRX7_9AGAR|nr:acyl-CoA N-acyltransferase [Mycena belliae]